MKDPVRVTVKNSCLVCDFGKPAIAAMWTRQQQCREQTRAAAQQEPGHGLKLL
jgi:hypothetical protein